MTTAGLVAMRSSCPRNPSGSQNGAKKGKTANEGYGAEVRKPGPHDVLLGRGGGTNNHSGNINFRRLVNEHKMRYLACSKIEKPNVAREVVELWKKLDPPGRFLSRKEEKKKDGESNDQVVWIEVPEKKAREKASQCLRERTPDVVPYIRQLREQQDQMTEQGVSMVQQQLKMQREAEAQKNSLHGMAAAAANFNRRNSMAEHNPYQQANPMAAMSGGADFGSRRGSMPMMNGGGGNMMNPMQQQQRQQAAFNRRVSAPHLSGNNHPHAGMAGGMPNNAAAMMGQMGQMGQFGGGGGMMEPGFIGSDNMYDPSYASSMTAMQLQQHHQQQLQLQQLQQQQMQLQHQMQMQQQHMAANMQAAHMQANMRGNRNMMGGMDAQWNMQSGGMGPNNQGMGMGNSAHGNGNQLNQSGSTHSNRLNMKDNSSSHRGSGRGGRARVPDAPPKSAPAVNRNVDREVEPISPPRPDTNTSAGIAAASRRDASPVRGGDPAAEASTKKQKKPAAKKKPAPIDTTPLPPSRALATGAAVVTPIDPPAGDEDDCPLPLNAADGSDDEVGIEEYRKTLESYMVNHNMTTQTPIYYSDEDDLSVESFPEWPDEGDHPERDGKAKEKRRGRAAPESRKVDRHKSNQSMMSCESRKTFKSNTTSLSGLSMLSDMMSMESGKLSRDEKMGASKRFSSNASIMSELTDISHTIDGLGLDDDI